MSLNQLFNTSLEKKQELHQWLFRVWLLVIIFPYLERKKGHYLNIIYKKHVYAYWDHKCVGESIEYDECSPGPCPAWTAWTAWTGCSRSCGGGRRKRLRECGVERTADCTGPNQEEQDCNTQVNSFLKGTIDISETFHLQSGKYGSYVFPFIPLFVHWRRNLCLCHYIYCLQSRIQI